MNSDEKVSDMVFSLDAAANRHLVERLSNWLSAPNPSSNLNAARTERQQETGIWLLESPIFRSWIQAPHSLLWLHGKPGCGKTILSSTVIHFLRDGNKKDKTVAYFYFDFHTHEKQLFQNFLNSIFSQLLNQTTLTIAEEHYNAYDNGRSTPTIEDTCIVLPRMIESIAAPVYIVIDALDECQETTSLLKGLKNIQSWNQKNLHIFVTSRQEPEIEDILCTLATDTIPLEESVIDADILTYVRHELQHDVKLSKWPREVREEIENALVKGANGMFKWVACQLDSIRGCMKLGLLRKALRTLPKTLDETYARILNEISEEYVEDARRILSCLICTFELLTIEAIAETVAIVTEGEAYYDVESQLQDPCDTLTICRGLVSKTEFFQPYGLDLGMRRLNGARLSHFSVQEYLKSDRIAKSQALRFALEKRHAHELLARLCINRLLWYGQEGLCPNVDQTVWTWNFATYAAMFWSHHLRAAQLECSVSLYSECLKMLARPGLIRRIIKMRVARRIDDKIYDFLKHLMSSYAQCVREVAVLDALIDAISPFYYVSILGCDELVLKLLAAGEDINKACPGTCLAAAAFFGHSTTVRLLLDKGAEANAVAQGSDGICYLPAGIQLAAGKGHEDVVSMLLAAGANVDTYHSVNTPNQCYLHFSDTPLNEAVRNPGAAGTRIARLLLDAGADLNAGRQRSFTSFLYLPILWRDIDRFTMLLDAGADPNAVDVFPTTPLRYAIETSALQCVKLLIERGADLEEIDSYLISALYVADSPDRVFLCTIEAALNVKAKLNTEMLLIAVSKCGYSDSVKYMLRNGTAPDAQDKNGIAALHAAAFAPINTAQVVGLFLDAGADVNIHGGRFESALQAAALSGVVKVVLILLEHSALPNHIGGSHGTALEIAKKRLEDWERSTKDRTWLGSIKEFGLAGWFDGAKSFKRRRRPKFRAGDDYVPHFKFSHLPNAEYQAIIDILQPYSVS